jgi:SAM-dependent MidA family methyltransferase
MTSDSIGRLPDEPSPDYDPALRRDTPLAASLRGLIREHGPIPLSRYMDICLHDPQHGYYRHRPAIGRTADFVTAPEISQTFGELIGLWCAVVWQRMGAPAPFQLIELGPGRGTLMTDALRAARLVPGFLQSADVVLVETNAALREAQRQAFEGMVVPLRWETAPDRVFEVDSQTPRKPAIFIANEFLDTLPVDQFERHSGGWRRRLVSIDSNERLAFVESSPREDGLAVPEAALSGDLDARFPDARIGDIVTVADYDNVIGRWLASPPTSPGGPTAVAALVIDYGDLHGLGGDTLQAVRNHRHEHPLTSPGEADLSALVDFRALSRRAAASGLGVDGPVTQAAFLGSLGIVERASRLMSDNPAQASVIEAGVARLMAPNAMGGRFKAIGIRNPVMQPLPGFS